MKLLPILKKIAGSGVSPETLRFEVVGHAKVDDELFDQLSKHHWTLGKRRKYGYVWVQSWIDGRERNLAHVVWELSGREMPPKPNTIDHINRDTFDNQLSNLESKSPTLQVVNRGKNRNNTSGYPGVSWQAKNRKWVAVIGVNGKNKYLGQSEDFQEACRIRFNAFRRYYPNIEHPEPVAL